jgi:hypothetical protein
MSRYRDNKGRFIAPKISEKIENQTTKKPPPYNNSSKICSGKILKGESSKEEIATIAKGTRSEATVYIKYTRQQERKEALVTPSKGETGKEAKVVIEEAASVVGRPHKTLEQLEIPGNPMVEPSLSG